MAIDQNILLTVDILVFARKDKNDSILLIRRKADPFKGQWAFPGGFVEEKEDLQEAACRELPEETGLKVEDLRQYKAVGTPGRDPRGRTVTIVFYGFIDERDMEVAKGGDDAAEASWFEVDDLPDLAFDHKEILEGFR